jgi:hypothetical protein
VRTGRGDGELIEVDERRVGANVVDVQSEGINGPKVDLEVPNREFVIQLRIRDAVEEMGKRIGFKYSRLPSALGCSGATLQMRLIWRLRKGEIQGILDGRLDDLQATARR